MSNRRNIRLLSLFSIEMKLKIRYIIIFLHNDVLCYGTMAIDNVRIVQSDLFEFEFTESWLKTTPKSGKYSFCFIIEFSVFFISPCPIFKMNWSMLYNIYNEFRVLQSIFEFVIPDTILLLALFRRNLFHPIKPHRTLKKCSLRPYCALCSLFTVHVTCSFISLSLIFVIGPIYTRWSIIIIINRITATSAR